jgi:hypothetical protein
MEMDTVRNPQSFIARWDGVDNFLMQGDWLPLRYDFPALPEVVARIRREDGASMGRGRPGAELAREAFPEFRELPIDEALATPFSLSHMALSRFYGAGDILDGFEEAVMLPWRQFLAAHEFTYHRCYPIIFITGGGCATNYHVDKSHVLAWQVYGHKDFSSLKEPGRWFPLDALPETGVPSPVTRPPALTDADSVTLPMPPGAMLWNALLTPHWVSAGDGPAMSVNISHGGLRHRGRLCGHGELLHAWYRKSPGDWF